MVRVNLEVEEQKKEKWEEYAEEHPESNGNLSAFIRSSVEKEIAVSHSGGSDKSEDILKKLGELGDSINQVHQRMDSVEKRLSSVESETHTESEVEELKGQVFDLLPDKKPGTRPWKAKKQELKRSAGANDGVAKEEKGWQGTPKALSEALDKREYLVSDAIERLQENTKLIRTTEYANKTRYYKVD